MNGVQQLVHCLRSVFSTKKSAGAKLQLLKTKLKGPFPDNFLTTGGCLKHNTYRITALGWPKKEGEQVWFSQVFGLLFSNSCYMLLLLLQTGASSISCSMYFRCYHLFFGDMLIRWLKLPSCFQVIPTYVRCYCEPKMSLLLNCAYFVCHCIGSLS